MNSFSRKENKINYGTRLKPDGTPNDNDRVEIGPSDGAFAEWARDGVQAPNLTKIREFRVRRLRAQMQLQNIGALLLFDPLNIRYATDAPNMQLWITHNFCRACLIIADGPMILWDFHNCEHLSQHNILIDEVRHGASAYFFETGNKTARNAMNFAKSVADTLAQYGKNRPNLALDKADIATYKALETVGFKIHDGQEVAELARSVKCADEIQAMRCAVHACQSAMREMEQHIQAGISENELWAHLHFGNIKRGGEWIETRLLASGQRTNPWFQECGPRIIQKGDVIALDTDLIGVYGMCVDISRTWVCEGKLNGEVYDDYQMAREQINYNMQFMKAGMSFVEITEKSYKLPEDYIANRYGVMYHGAGLCDEYPSIRYPQDYEACGYDGILESGMVICVESLISRKNGKYSIKLEEQVVITQNGCEILSTYPFLGA